MTGINSAMEGMSLHDQQLYNEVRTINERTGEMESQIQANNSTLGEIKDLTEAANNDAYEFYAHYYNLTPSFIEAWGW